MIPEKTNPAPDGLPVTGFANLENSEFNAAVLQGLLSFVHIPNKEQPDAEANPRIKSVTF